MLHQDINLYRSFEKPKTAPSLLSWQRFWFANLMIIVAFFAIYLVSTFSVYYLKSTKHSLEEQISSLQKEFFVRKNEYPPFFFTQDVSESLQKLETALNTQENILDSLRNRIPFSQELTALARLIVPDVWLTEILLTEGGNEINLKGQSLSMENLQGFIANLLQEKLFANYQLNVKNIQNAGNAQLNNQLTFEINFAKKQS